MKKISTLVVLLLAAALTLGMVGSATGAGGITASKVKKIAKKQIAKAAPSLSVANAVNATNATNSAALEGKSLAQIKTVLAGAQNSAVVDIGAGTDVVTVNYTLAAASRVNFSGVVELTGDGSTGDEAVCTIRNDGSGVSLSYETTFDDIGVASSNPASLVVLTSVAAVPAGAHIATLRCSTVAGGPVIKDDAAISLVAVPN